MLSVICVCNLWLNYVATEETNNGTKIEKLIPAKIPVIKKAAPNIPAIGAYSFSTDL